MPISVTIPDATVEEVKAEAESRILSSYPLTKQINMLARATELQEIIIGGGTFSPAEQAEYDALIAIKAWIGSVRSASDTIELDPPKIDKLRTDSRWP